MTGLLQARREMILDLAKYSDKRVRITFQGGREVVGVLKGFDQLVNLVLDDAVEYIRDSPTGETRDLGMVVARGPNVAAVCPDDGMREIENPFLAPEEGAAGGEAGDA